MKLGDITAPEHQANGKPLDGIRILAIEQMQSLPYGTQLLARMGAEVVKIEHPVRGDLGRGSTPGITDPQGRPVGGTYLRNNLNKRSVGMDLKNPAAIDLIRRMVPRFDVLAENLKPGTLAKAGLGYEDLAQLHPGLIYLSVSGFGNLGQSPYGHWPAYAPIAEAMGGLYAINRAEGEDVTVSPVGALGDTGSGLFAVIGVLMALRQRERHGHGQYVDISMFDAMVAFGDMVPNYWSLGTDPRIPTSIINDGFPIDSGELVIQIGREHQFERLCPPHRPSRMADRRPIFHPPGVARPPGGNPVGAAGLGWRPHHHSGRRRPGRRGHRCRPGVRGRRRDRRSPRGRPPHAGGDPPARRRHLGADPRQPGQAVVGQRRARNPPAVAGRAHRRGAGRRTRAGPR